MIANYIFGGNTANEEISMTSPVVMKPYDNHEMAFIMPNHYTLSSYLNQTTVKSRFLKYHLLKKLQFDIQVIQILK